MEKRLIVQYCIVLYRIAQSIHSSQSAWCRINSRDPTPAQSLYSTVQYLRLTNMDGSIDRINR